MVKQKIVPVTVPKLGMTMKEGKVVDWQVKAGDEVVEGDEIVGIETEKITNVCEAPGGRRVPPPGRP